MSDHSTYPFVGERERSTRDSLVSRRFIHFKSAQILVLVGSISLCADTFVDVRRLGAVEDRARKGDPGHEDECVVVVEPTEGRG